MKTYFDQNRNCYVDECGRYVRVDDDFDPTIHREGYFFSKDDEEEEYIQYLNSIDVEGSN
jgi:hypothetical protein